MGLSRSQLVVLALCLPALGCDDVLGADFGHDQPNPLCKKPGHPCGRGICTAKLTCKFEDTKLSAMFHHTCAVLKDGGDVWCWGENQFGEVGDGTTEFHSRAWKVVGIPAAQAIAAGEGHTCIIGVDDDVWCWGDNHAGQCGGTPTPGLKPEPVFPQKVPGLQGIHLDELTAGRAHTCGVNEAEGSVYCWGFNGEHQIGPMPDLSLPVTKLTQVDHVMSVHALKYHTCATRSEAPRMVCWGRNYHGQLGPLANGVASTGEPIAIELPDGATPAGVGMTFETTYAVADTGRVYAWGYNKRGQAGGYDEATDTIPEHVLEPTAIQFVHPEKGLVPLEDVVQVYSADSSNECAQVIQPEFYGARFVCWGGDDRGEFGRGFLEDPPGKVFPRAQPSKALPYDLEGLAFAEDHGCGLLPINEEKDEIVCWGRGGFVGDGQEPLNPGEDSLTPQLVPQPILWEPE